MFKNILENSEEDQDVLDRAGYYYNGLKNDMNKLRDVFEEMKYARIEQSSVIEIDSANYEFNTLSVVYNKPAEAFIKSYEFFKSQRNKDDSLYEDLGEDEEPSTQNNQVLEGNSGEKTQQQEIHEGGNGEESTDGNAEESEQIGRFFKAIFDSLELVNYLDDEFTLDQSVFQEAWMSTEES